MGLNVSEVQLSYGKKRILDELSFEINDGEIVALFGPSGVGKTSLLKMIAGIQPVNKGKIIFSEGYSQESTVLVFQDFWLFPHMNVVDNIAFGLKARKFSKERIREKINKILAAFDLKGLEKQFPDELSGGQKQRVALARAIVLEPKLLLLDEPFANLDSHLKEAMREYLRRLQKTYCFSVILVTHDRDEAFQLADRMILLLDGKIQQIGTPQEIYFYPRNKKVAKSIGENNFIPGVVSDHIFTLENTHLTVRNPTNIQGAASLFIPYGAEIEVCEAGVPALVEHHEWTPNGQRTQVKIGNTSCIFTNLSKKIIDQRQIFLKFNDDLQVMPR